MVAALLAILAAVPPAHAQTTQLITLTATANGQTRIDLSWNTPNSAVSNLIRGYKIEVSPSGDDASWTTLVEDTGSTGTTYSHTGLTAGTTRHYRIAGVWFARTFVDHVVTTVTEGSLISNVASATTDIPTQAPGTPTGLTATVNGQTRIDLSWTAPAGGEAANVPTGYKIETSPSGEDGSWTTLESDTGNTGTTYGHLGLAASTTRYYRVSAVNAIGISRPSDEANATTDGVGALVMESLPGALKVRWAKEDRVGFSSYNLQWTPRTVAPVEISNRETTSYTITGLTPGTSYSVEFFLQFSANTSESRYATGTPLLGKVAGVTATAASTTSVQVGWTAVAGAEHYAVQWKSGAQDWSTERQATTTSASHTITELQPSTAYTVRVQARLTGVSSGEWSEDAAATTHTPTMAPGKPTSLTATAPGPLQIDLSWTAPSETSESVVTGYKIESSPTGAANSWTVLVADTGNRSTKYSHTGLSEGTTRHYRVSALNSFGTSGPSNEASATTTAAATAAPGAPSGLTATPGGITVIKLAWTAPSDAVAKAVTGYKIEWSRVGADSWMTQVEDTGDAGTAYDVDGLNPETPRSFRVRAINSVGDSAASNVATATTYSAGVVGLKATAVGQTQIDITWTPAEGIPAEAPTGYQVQVATGSGGSFSNLGSKTGQTTVSHTGLSPGTTRYYKVITQRTGRNGISGEVSATTESLKPPTGLTATAYGQTRIDLSWTAPTGEAADAPTGYKIEVSPSGEDGSWTDLAADTGSAGTTYSHSGLTFGTTRHYRVSTINANGTSVPSNVASATTEGAETLPPVENLIVESVSATSLKASWSAVAEADNYIVQWRKPRTGQDWSEEFRSESETTTSLTFTVSASSIDHEALTVRVRPETTGRAFGPWAYAFGTQTALVPPTGLTATASGSGTVNLAWTAPSVQGKTIEDYMVQWESAAGDDFGEKRTGSTTATATTTGLHPGTAYTFYVRAVFDDGTASLTATAAVTTAAAGAAPGKPTGLTATAASETAIKLSWTPAAGQGVTGYAIQSRTGAGGWTTLVGDTGNSYTGYVHTGLAPGTTYHYRVLGGNTVGTSPWSDEANATTDTHESIAFFYEIPDAGYWKNQGGKNFMPEAYRPGQSAPHGPYTYTLTLSDDSSLPGWLRFDAATRALSPVGPGNNPVELTVELKWTAAERDDSSVSKSQTFTLYRCETAAHQRDIEACEESHRDFFNSPPEFKQKPTNQTATAGQGFVYLVPAATDIDGDTITYTASLADGSDLPSWLPFSVSSPRFSGLPQAAHAPAELEIKVTATDPLGAKASVYFILTVKEAAVGNSQGGDQVTGQQGSEPANREPAFDAGIVTTLTLDENSAAGTNVGSAITATDPDDGDTVTYSLTGTDAASFDIGSSTGQITTKTGVTYDFESKSSYSLTVNASDGKLSNSTPVTVSLNDVNEAPAFAGSSATRAVAENSAAGTNVGDAITAADPDANATLAYSLSGTDAASFAIGGSTGQITTVANVDYNYESKSSYSLTVTASDGKLSDSIDVTVNLNDVNEAPAFAAATATRAVAENSAAGTNVGSAITATDPDKDATLTYSLSGTDAASFAIGGSTGQITTKTGVTYDYEAKSSYSLIVTASDGKLTDSIDVTVNLTDVAEATPATECRTTIGALSAAALYSGKWDDANCKAHHQDSRARYFHFTVSGQQSVTISLSAGSLYVSKDTPNNGWGAAPKGTYEHRREVRRDNGKLMHDGPHVATAQDDGRTVTLSLAAGTTYTVEAAGDSGDFTVSITPQ